MCYELCGVVISFGTIYVLAYHLRHPLTHTAYSTLSVFTFFAFLESGSWIMSIHTPDTPSLVINDFVLYHVFRIGSRRHLWCCCCLTNLCKAYFCKHVYCVTNSSQMHGHTIYSLFGPNNNNNSKSSKLWAIRYISKKTVANKHMVFTSVVTDNEPLAMANTAGRTVGISPMRSVPVHVHG